MSSIDGEEKRLVTMATTLKRPHSPDEEIGDKNSANQLAKDLQNNDSELFNLPWEDILIPKVACYLSIKDIFRLRCVSSTAKRLADDIIGMLKELDLSFSDSKTIAVAFQVLAQNCRHLERLYLMRCRWLCDEPLLELLRRNTRLRELNLNDCLTITALSIQPVIVECKQLRKLELANCIWLTTGAVEALALHHSNLEYLDLSGCIAVAERSLIFLFKKQCQLNTLSVQNMHNITDQSLLNIGKYCPLLEILMLKNCINVTDIGIQAIVAQCRHLRSLLIKGCPHINEHTLAPLRGHVFIDRSSVGPFHHYRFYPNDFLIY